MFDYSKLRGKIVEKFGSQSEFSKAMGCSERTLSLKLTGKRSWKQPEICKALSILGLSDNDVKEFFFTPEVQNIELYQKSDKGA